MSIRDGDAKKYDLWVSQETKKKILKEMLTIFHCYWDNVLPKKEKEG